MIVYSRVPMGKYWNGQGELAAVMGQTMKLVGLAGWSGSGKTSLIARLIPLAIGRGFTVSTVKHAHHDFDIDQPGKDSWVHRQAGATEVLVASSRRVALMHELRAAPEPSLDALLARLTPVDLVFIEGWRHGAHPRIEVHRPELGKPLILGEEPGIVAVASPEPLGNVRIPWLPLDEPAEILDFVLSARFAIRPA